MIYLAMAAAGEDFSDWLWGMVGGKPVLNTSGVMPAKTELSETMSAALAYAQSGHLVFATLHANNAHNALNRIVSFYAPEHRQVMLSDLAATLRAIASQRLVRAMDGQRIPAVELLLNTRHVAELIEKGQLTSVSQALEQSLSPGSQTFEQALCRLVREGRVPRDEALAFADSPTNLLWLLDQAESSAPVLSLSPSA
jgi:twitching motility protein PilU